MPGISGRFLILGVSVLFKYFQRRKINATNAIPVVWYDIRKKSRGMKSLETEKLKCATLSS